MFILVKNRILWKFCPLMVDSFPLMKFCTKVNPGARRRAKLVGDTNELEADDLDYEADFENVHRSHKQHNKEIKLLKEKQQYHIVEQKYFKTKFPNFLTWHDKEQIRLLHRNDPEEWTVMKLSEGFPALPQIIRKIVKSNWRKETIAKIKSHDASVQQNWRKFKNNEFNDLPEDLVQHLNKFSDRDFNCHNYEATETNDKIELKNTHGCSEFSEIITSYMQLKNGKSENINTELTVDLSRKDKPKAPSPGDTFVDGKIKSKRHFTLDSLKNKLEKDFERGRHLPYTDLQIVDTETKTDGNLPEKIAASRDQLDSVKYNTGKIMVVDEKQQRDYDHLVYPDRIRIPKEILKRGHTYKLNDCYYDSDGRFLYRVPGMY